MNCILVTGASGAIGLPLVAALRGGGADVVAMRSRGLPDALNRVADFVDPASLARAFEGVDTLLLRLPLGERTLRFARNALAAARSAGVRHVVRIGDACADASSPYALARLHGAIDAAVLESGLPTTLMRPAALMQDWAGVATLPVAPRVVETAWGDGAQAWVDARDVAAAAAAVLRDPGPHAGRTYLLTGPRRLTAAGFAAVVADATGRPLEVRPVSAERAARALADRSVPAWRIELLDSMARWVADGRAPDACADIGRLICRPPIDAARFARDYASLWR